MNEPNALLMDIGNVLLKVDISGVSSSLLAHGASLRQESSRDLYALALKYEEGALSSETFLEQACQLTGLCYPSQRDLLKQAWNAVFPDDSPIPLTIDTCRMLKNRGIRLVLFSNTNELHVNYMGTNYPELKNIFDEAIYSHIVGAEKPAPPMYLEARNVLGLDPARTLYFDDRPENIQAGRDFGFQAHVFDYNRPETFLNFLPESWKE